MAKRGGGGGTKGIRHVRSTSSEGLWNQEDVVQLVSTVPERHDTWHFRFFLAFVYHTFSLRYHVHGYSFINVYIDEINAILLAPDHNVTAPATGTCAQACTCGHLCAHLRMCDCAACARMCVSVCHACVHEHVCARSCVHACTHEHLVPVTCA